VHLCRFVRSAWSTTLPRWSFNFGWLRVDCSFATTHCPWFTIIAYDSLPFSFADLSPSSFIVAWFLPKFSCTALSQLTTTDSFSATRSLTERILVAWLLFCIVNVSIQISFLDVFEYFWLNWDAATSDGFLGWICMMSSSGVEHQILVLPFL
jgi:hypothetical protein